MHLKDTLFLWGVTCLFALHLRLSLIGYNVLMSIFFWIVRFNVLYDFKYLVTIHAFFA
jgi:hypothetical protein